MKTARPVVLAAALLAVAGGAFAQQTIDHSKVLAGGVTPGDTPGYPLTLSLPGHYKLTSNLSVPANTTGIRITAPNVTLDLNGYTVAGPVTCMQITGGLNLICSPGSDGKSYGIEIGTTSAGTVIRNGRVQGFAHGGIRTVGADTLEGVQVTQNAGHGVSGIETFNSGVNIIDSLITLNAGAGVAVASGVVTRTRVVANGDGILGTAIQSVKFVSVNDSLVTHNAGVGLNSVTPHGTLSAGNGTNRMYVISRGSNLDGSTVY